MYHGYTVATCSVSDIHSVVRKFIDNLHANISKRFPDTDLLSAFGVMWLRPITFLKEEEIEKWGEKEFEILLKHYGKKVHSWKTPEGDQCEAVADPLVDAHKARQEWLQLKKTVRREGFARHSTLGLDQRVVQFYPHDFPNIIKLAQCAVTLQVHTADVEQTFSCQNRVCTGLRNALTPATQDMLMTVYLEGPKTLQDLNQWVVEVVDKCSAKRKRLLFTSRPSTK